MSRLIHFLFYILFFFTPLIFWPKTSELFEFNKMLFVYLMTGFILSAWAIKSVLDKKLVIRRTPLDLPILLFLASQIISTVISIDPHTSLWGYYSRFHGGLISTLCYISLFYALVSNFSKTLDSCLPAGMARFYILDSILGSAFLVSLYAILERMGIDKAIWVQDVQSRVFSTLGQPNWLSAYLLAILPLPIFKIFEKNVNQNKSSKSINRTESSKGFIPAGREYGFGFAQICYLTLSIIILASILFTRSQSGLFATAVVLLITSFILLKPTFARFKIPYSIFSIIIISSFFFFQKPLLSKISSSFSVFSGSLSEAVNRDNATRFGGSNSMLIRRVVWTGAIKLGEKYPLFGTGVETFGYSYYWVRPPEHNLLSEWDFLYNKAHNEYLNMLANTGFVGLTTYLILILAIIRVFLKPVRPDENQAQHAHASQERASMVFAGQTGVSIPLFLGFLSILITNFFGFSVVTIGLFFFLFPALVILENNHHTSITIPIEVPQSITISIIIFLALTWSIRVGRSFSADLAYNQGKAYLSIGSLEPALKFLSLASKTLPSEPLFYSALGEAQAQAAATVNQQLTTLSATNSAETITEGKRLEKAFLESSKANSEKALSLNKYQANFYKTKAKAELYLSIIDPAYRLEALKTLLTLSSYAPTDAKVFYNIGLIQQELGNSSAALVAYRQALSLKPDFQAVKNLLSPPSP